MTIGANLNGGSLTLGSANSNGVALLTKTLVSIATDGLQANGKINIATGNNGTGSYVLIGNNSLGSSIIRGNSVAIGDNGLSATGNILIGSGTNNAVGSYIMIGDTSLTNCYMRGKDVNINYQQGTPQAPVYTYIGNNTAGLVTIAGNANIATNGGDTNIGTGATSGNTIIGNSTSSRYTLIASKGITLGRYLSDGGYVDIAAEANTTTGYTILGSGNLQNNYIRGRNVNINSDVNGTTNIGSSSGSNILRCSATFIGFSSNNWPGGTCCTISSKGHPTRGDALGIQTLMDNGQYIISFFNDAGGVRAMIRGINSTTVEYATSSDRRLKKNIQPMDSMLENIMQMKPCSFGWISNEDTGYGFIAQEVYEIFPHLRHKHPSCLESCNDSPCDCSGNPVYYGLDYGQFTPYIVKAMQEMKQDYDKQLQEMKLNYEKRLSNIEELLNIT